MTSHDDTPQSGGPRGEDGRSREPSGEDLRRLTGWLRRLSEQGRGADDAETAEFVAFRDQVLRGWVLHELVCEQPPEHDDPDDGHDADIDD